MLYLSLVSGVQRITTTPNLTQATTFQTDAGSTVLSIMLLILSLGSIIGGIYCLWKSASRTRLMIIGLFFITLGATVGYVFGIHEPYAKRIVIDKNIQIIMVEERRFFGRASESQISFIDVSGIQFLPGKTRGSLTQPTVIVEVVNSYDEKVSVIQDRHAYDIAEAISSATGKKLKIN